MKTINFIKRMVFVVAVAMLASVAYSQEKGDMSAGVNVSYGTSDGFSNFGFGAKFRYNITDAIRVEPSATYFLEKDYTNMWDINANVHYLFPVADKFVVYPLAGVTMMGVKVEVLGFSDSESKFGANLGGGVDYKLTDNIDLNLEIKYQLVSDFDRPVFSIGGAYRF